MYNSLGDYQHALEYYKNSLVMIEIVHGAEVNCAVKTSIYSSIAYKRLGDKRFSVEYRRKLAEKKALNTV